ncbi:MAG: bifunctional 5,6,7,8-tetrahydromethanopterin hydro-lyase/3-hexulose-6-phosphate synthase [Candidatus Bathyarchaeota archaeon]|uniref:bifunctional 5,6,7,8-tetrahydromethanopterin hydro-lyase/3-hexulose-6-phosphate synthase n=1 Tax=Candidatus Bathycorpusculum sp. TaxID=2994959 RepID=UPI002832C2A3|nr:bifunctional 5,6,7,8-tetrahydromethanopterin hydro-lyase/3-hexulose-6-phosphate synthase [Candidatus Termiticorpusculum sp.]MCL2291631.1 bifunctional 5,6,7,8-tetrahydromethanopterin hydro-lyase/3-hexulose-6-phosphate synthase [Candidatus Termiticorpusculum sp.]
MSEFEVKKLEKQEDVFIKNREPTYLVGESLVGDGNELAHVDLLIGDKNGPVGQAFAAGMTCLSAGHTPLLAVIRPNLPSKPHTLIVPKVTVKNMKDAGKIFGPAQAAVAKAVADAVEEGIIPATKLDKWIIIASVFIHPQAVNYRKIYQYNYSATNMAIQRALIKYPSIDKMLYDKDRAKHPIMGFKVPRLWRPPYLQISLDAPSLENAKKIIEQLPESDRIILEIGTPLIKQYGTKIINEIRTIAPDTFIIADLKNLDVGKVEVDTAYDNTADAVVTSGLAPIETLDAIIHETKRLGIATFIDMLNAEENIPKLKTLKELPDVIALHHGIDQENRLCHNGSKGLKCIKLVRQAFPNKKVLIAVTECGTPEIAKEALNQGADILIVGRYITQSQDIKRSTQNFLEITPTMREDIDLYRVHTE